MPDVLHATRLPLELKQKLEALVGKEVAIQMRWSSSRHKGLHMIEDEEYDAGEGSREGNAIIASVGEYGFFVYGHYGQHEAIVEYDPKQRIYAMRPVPQGQSYFPFHESKDIYFQSPKERGDDYRSNFEVSEIASISHQGEKIFP